MKFLTEDVKMICEHAGKVTIAASQDYVMIDGRLILVDDDPEGRTIKGCPNGDPAGVSGVKSCTKTLKVKQGYSTWIRINHKSVCLSILTGTAHGTPPGLVKYLVADPGQKLVTEAAS